MHHDGLAFDDGLDLDDMEWKKDFDENYSPRALLRNSSSLTLGDMLEGKEMEVFRVPI